MPEPTNGVLGSLNRLAQGLLHKRANIQCPRCQTKVDAAAIDVQRMLATCKDCGLVFDVRKPTEQAPPKPAAPIAKPEGIVVRREELDDVPILRGAQPSERLVIVRPWRQTGAVVLLVSICIAHALGLLGIWLSRAPSMPAVMTFGALGTVMTYVVLGMVMNRTTLVLEPNRLTVSHGPLPWMGNVSMPTSDLEQIYCERTSGGGGQEPPIFAVRAKLTNGERLSLVKTGKDLEQARYIEQEIESYLGIADSQVVGEYRSAG